jgi:hypothetical protein
MSTCYPFCDMSQHTERMPFLDQVCSCQVCISGTKRIYYTYKIIYTFKQSNNCSIKNNITNPHRSYGFFSCASQLFLYHVTTYRKIAFLGHVCSCQEYFSRTKRIYLLTKLFILSNSITIVQ